MSVATAARVTAGQVIAGDRLALAGWPLVEDVRPGGRGRIRLVLEGDRPFPALTPGTPVLVRHADTEAPAAVQAEPETHPLPKPGDLVISRHYSGQIAYGGPSSSPGFYQLAIGRTVELFADVEDVAPVDAPAVDAKDPRIVVEKLNAREHGVFDVKSQAWRATLPGAVRVWRDTKRDAVAAAQVALTVADWHAARAASQH